MNEPTYQIDDYMNCPHCSGRLINVTVDGEDKLQCNQCLNYYVPIATTPFDGGGPTDDDWEELYNR